MTPASDGGPAADTIARDRGHGSRRTGQGSRPTLSRRHAMGETSARSLLFTVLGEFVLPHDEPVWTSALVKVLNRLGVEEKSARQALARSAADGWLSSERVGRTVRWSLTPPGRRLLTEGAERIYSFSAAATDWDGSWLVLHVSVPESKRKLRHRLRTRLSWAGFGSPEPGVWISPHPSHEVEARAVIAGLGLNEQAMSFTGHFSAIGHEQSMVDRAWNIDELAVQYEEFIDEFTGVRPASGDGVLLAQAQLVHQWRRFPFLDPQLPHKLLPPRWSGERAAELFHHKHAGWHGDAQARWLELAATST